MEEYNYIERRNMIRAKKRTVKPKKQSYFMLKLNMALAVGVTVVCAKMIDLDVTDNFVDKVKAIITQNSDTESLKADISGFFSGFDGKSNIFVFAGEKHPITMDDELIAQMNDRENAYINAQKKTP